MLLPVKVCTVQYYDDDILQPYHGTCHEILLESMHPDTPRIVVTPPEEGTNIAWANAIGPQYYSYLTVIPFYYSTCWLPSLEEYAQMFYAAHLQTPGQDSNSLNNSDAFSESSLLETPSEMGLIKSNYSMSLEDELQELNISLPYQSLDQAAANVFLVKAPSEGASKFFIDNHGSWDTDSLPDMETDPFFVEVCAQLAGSAKTVMGTP
ncbi:hypothetical protein BDN70DRAFT_499586 [Pholiota conissans]|uniref:Uncharacterized protein n=1 Tax=Pholiota conissans TaxID=109636 RepID=A0A9P5Z6Q6_9AGAR|nr:hypothetical protein BDN70DRAFT_499586 [Pholiota conissans]